MAITKEEKLLKLYKENSAMLRDSSERHVRTWRVENKSLEEIPLEFIQY